MKKRILPLIAFLFIAALSASALPPPEDDEIRLDELEEHLADLDGKIVEVEFAYARSVTQSSALCMVLKHSGNMHRSSTLKVSFSGEDSR